MGRVNYKAIYEKNKHDWYAMTEEPQKYEALLAGHYSDSNHFVYELLQNAEDENADRVVIEFYADRLIFYHNGDPFDENDVIELYNLVTPNLACFKKRYFLLENNMMDEGQYK